LDLFWSMLWFFLFFAWIWLLISVFSDIFRSSDLSGGGKALWTLFVLILPYLGVFVYLIARGGQMQERSMEEAVRREEATRKYIQQAAAGSAGGGGSSADEIAKLAQLRDQGHLTEAEFATQKAKILA
jgi:Short C-terminal domain/Phospholipase_D-nuclease N-terminal